MVDLVIWELYLWTNCINFIAD